MKLIFAFFLSLCTVTLLKAQDQPSSLHSTRLVSGYPEGASGTVEYFNLTEVKYAELNTGLDSLQLFFGSFIKNSRDGYWVGLNNEGNFIFTMVSLDKMMDSQLLTQNIEFNFNESSKRVSFRIDVDPQTEDVSYQWLSPQGDTYIAYVQTVERLIEPNKAMPFFTAETLQEAVLSLDDFKGKHLVINWWATSCAPCLVEMPGLNELVDKYKHRDDVEFLAIARDSQERLEKFFEKRSFDYQQTLANEEVTALFGESFPKHVVIDPEGMVTYFSSGGNKHIHLAIDQHLTAQLGL